MVPFVAQNKHHLSELFAYRGKPRFKTLLELLIDSINEIGDEEIQVYRMILKQQFEENVN